MSTLDPMAERAAATILVEATDAATAAADPQVAAFLQSCSDLLGREAASIMDLRWRHDLDSNATSSQLSIPVEWVNDQVAMLPALYGNMVRSRILWFGGQPLHDDLAGQLAAAGVTEFDAATSRMILAHARSCETCDDHTTMRVEPISVFASTRPPAPPAPPARPTPPATDTTSSPAYVPDAATAARIAAAAAAAAAGTTAAAASSPPQRYDAPSPPPTGPRHAPVGGTTVDEDSARRKKKYLVGAIIGAVAIVMLGGFLLTRGDDQPETIASGGESPTTVENRVYQSTSSTASTTTTTAPPTTTTTAPPPMPDGILATMNGGPSANVPQGFPTIFASLEWVSIIAPRPPTDSHTYFDDESGISYGGAGSAPVERWVEVRGAGVTTSRQPETGSMQVCPSAETGICNVIPGSYDYVVKLFADGVEVASATVTLIVDPPLAP